MVIERVIDFFGESDDGDKWVFTGRGGDWLFVLSIIGLVVVVTMFLLE